MKKKIAFSLFAFTICSLLFLQSCDGDDIPLDDQENYIKYRVTCDTPHAQLHIDANGLGETGLYVKESFEKELYTKGYFAIVEVRCEDPKVAIHVDLYVNKKFRTSADGNRSVFISERLKGKGPYLR